MCVFTLILPRSCAPKSTAITGYWLFIHLLIVTLLHFNRRSLLWIPAFQAGFLTTRGSLQSCSRFNKKGKRKQQGKLCTCFTQRLCLGLFSTRSCVGKRVLCRGQLCSNYQHLTHLPKIQSRKRFAAAFFIPKSEHSLDVYQKA